MKTMLRTTGLVILASLGLILGGCAHVGFSRGGATNFQTTLPGGEHVHWHVHNQQTPNWTIATDKIASNYAIINGSDAGPTKVQQEAVAKIDKGCNRYTIAAEPSTLASIFFDGLLFVPSTALSLAQASQAFPGTVASQYRQYGAWIGGGSAFQNGALAGGSRVGFQSTCVNRLFEHMPSYGIIGLP